MAEIISDPENYQVNGAAGRVGGPDDVMIVYCTFPDGETAKAVGRALVEARLAACVNVLAGMTAIYEWDGALQEDGEVSVIIKTRRALVASVFAQIRAGHSYDNPAMVEIEVAGGSTAYLSWVKAQTNT